jgi:hypothetical protein
MMAAVPELMALETAVDSGVSFWRLFIVSVYRSANGSSERAISDDSRVCGSIADPSGG